MSGCWKLTEKIFVHGHGAWNYSPWRNWIIIYYLSIRWKLTKKIFVHGHGAWNYSPRRNWIICGRRFSLYKPLPGTFKSIDTNKELPGTFITLTSASLICPLLLHTMDLLRTKIYSPDFFAESVFWLCQYW